MNKLHNIKTNYDGKTFDSKKEARRYTELVLMQRAKVITGLECQKSYTLIPAQYADGRCIEKSCKYIADFVYQENGKTVIEDVKGYKKGATYQVFAIKRKLMLSIYGIRVREV